MRMLSGVEVGSVALLVLLTIATPNAVQGETRGLTVFAAASMKTAPDAIAADGLGGETGFRPTLVLAATSALARQIE